MSTHAINSESGRNKQMKDWKEIYTQTNYDTIPSTTYYMEILDENPDDDETMRNLAELLLDSTATEHQEFL
jgi:hypothetical protein